MSARGAGHCSEDAELQAYAQGSLKEGDADRITAHPATCEACRKAIAAHAPTQHAGASTAAASGPSSPTAFLDRGAALGRYVVLERLGEGGMGVVYAAYDPHLDRKVALKLLRSDRSAADTEARARMLREGQAMARLSHPNVVPVHDVGVYEGRLFVAMEWIDGETLRAWRTPERTWREVVAVYLQAARGLAAAHDAGLVHRDFKPDNALVGRDGRVRVVDFGLARAGGTGAVDVRPKPPARASALETPLTEHGAVVGTPRYMAPEQLSGERTDAASDQFSFCASLYEALYGEMPFGGSEDLLSLIAHVSSDEIRPPRAGKNVPAWLRQVVRRGLSADPAARYPSMRELMAALDHDPGRARRRWLLLGGVGAVVASASAATFAVVAHRAPLCPSAEPELAGIWDADQRRTVTAAFLGTRATFAPDALRSVAATLDRYTAGWVAMRGDACAATRVRGQQSDEMFDLRVQCLRQELEDVRALVGQLDVANTKTVEGAVRAVDSLPPLARCADESALRAPVREPADPSVRARIDAVRRKVAEARALERAGRAIDGARTADGAVTLARAIGYEPLQAEALEVQGMIAGALDLKKSAAALEDATIAAMAGRDEALEAQAWVELVLVAATDTRCADGHSYARHAHAALERSPDETRMATLLTAEGMLAEGEEQLDVSEELLRKALALQEKILPADHPTLADTMTQLGSTLMRLARYDEALVLHRRAIAIREKAYGPSHPLVAGAYMDLGNALSGKGAYVEAIAADRHALDLYTAAYGTDNKAVADVLQNLGLVVTYGGNAEEGVALEQRAVAIAERISPPGDDEITGALINEIEALNHTNRLEETIATSRRTVAMIEARHGPTYPTLASPLCTLAEALRMAKRFPEAQSTAERAIAIEESTASEPALLATTRHVLASTLLESGGDRARARALADQARATLSKEPVGNAPELRELDRDFPAGQ